MSRVAACAWLLVLAAPTIETRPARAEDGRTAPPAPSVVRVYVAGTPLAVEKTRGTVRELLSRLGLDVIVQEATDEAALDPPREDSLARAFLDLRTPSAPRIVVRDGDTMRELERRTLPASASLEVAVEEAAHVLYMVVESSLQARDPRRVTDASSSGARSSRSDAPAPAGAAPAPSGGESSSPHADRAAAEARPEGAAPPELEPRGARGRGADTSAPSRGRAKTDFELDLSVFGGGAAFDHDHVLGGFGAAVDAGVRAGGVRLSAGIVGRAFLPSEVSRSGETASLEAESGRLLGTAEWQVSTPAAVALSLGGGIDRVSLDAGRPTPSVWAAGIETRVDPIVEALCAVKLRISDAVSAFAAVALDVDLSPHQYVTETGGVRSTFFAPARVRPDAFLGLSFRLAGAPAPGASRDAERD